MFQNYATKLEKIIPTVDESPFYCLVLCFVCVYGILIDITYEKEKPIVGIRMLDGIHTYNAGYGEDKNSCIGNR